MLKAFDGKVMQLNRWWDTLDQTNPTLRFLLFMLFVAFPLSFIYILPRTIGVPFFIMGATFSLLRVYAFLRPKNI